MTILRSLAVACSSLLFAFPTTAQNLGAAFDLNVDGYIDVPMTPDLIPQSGITIEAWFTYDDSLIPLNWRYPTIVRQGDNAGNPSENYFLRMNCNNNAARVLTWKVVTTNGAQLSTSYSFTAGQFVNWTHVAATYDGASLTLYINGVQVSTAAGNGFPIRSNSDPLRIGKGSHVATPIEVWNGQLDEVRLWPFARTATDIQETMNLELTSVPGRVSTWNLNNDALDSSNGQNGAITGQVTFTANTLTLTPPLAPAGIPTGYSTPGCLGDTLLSCSGTATPGYTDFGVVCTRVPAGSLMLWGASAGVFPVGFPIFGVDVFLDPTGLVTLTTLADSLGAARVNIPVGATVPLGASFGIQALALDPCGPQGFTASNAMTVVVQ